MKFPPFAYHVPRTLDKAVDTLAADADASIIAGGQSLLPLLALRLARPSALVDLGNIEGLSFIEKDGETVKIGAMTTQREVERSVVVAALLPLVHEAVQHVAHVPIRNRGTFGGNLAHADPASELPGPLLALDANLVLEGPDGSRTVEAKDFWVGPFTTVAAQGEILTRVEIPARPGSWTFMEVARRSGDFPLAMAAVGLGVEDGRCKWARIVLHGVSGAPVRAERAEAALAGTAIDNGAAEHAAEIATAQLSPISDIHCSSESRRQIARTLVRRAITETRRRAA